MKEIWKDIDGYDGLYQISTLGNVKSLANRSNHKDEKILKCSIVCGYVHVGLCKNGKQKIHKVHRLVANAFLKNPYKLPEVNHKNGNKQDNTVSNLEWVTSRENSLHAFRNGLRVAQKGKDNRRSIKVIQMTKSGEMIAKFNGMREAERETGISHFTISDCCKGVNKNKCEFLWRYADE